jgi:regulator of protease activity HflC (stomatin/prohibitin superfamily)
MQTGCGPDLPAAGSGQEITAALPEKITTEDFIMSERMQIVVENVRKLAGSVGGNLYRSRCSLIALGLVALGGYALYSNPPMQSVGRGEVGMRLNQLTGASTEVQEGAIVVIPGLHSLRRFSLRDQIYRPEGGQRANGSAPFQTVEGLSIGVDISVRYALDPARIASMARALPEDIGGEVVQPAVQGVLYKTLARYTVREVFSTKRQEIRESIENELRPLLAKDGIKLQAVLVGKVDLPADYKRGMESLLAEELASEKMRYTLELKEKQVKETELEAQADKVRRENGRRSRRPGADHRRQITGRGDEARAAVQAEADRAARARSRGRERLRASRMPKAIRRRAASRPPARPNRGKSSPTPKATGRSAWARSPAEQLARDGALITRSIRC